MERDNKKRKRDTNKMKNTKEKHYIAEVQEQHGEYEHTTKYLFILSSVGEVKEVSLEHYNVLKKYLSVL